MRQMKNVWFTSGIFRRILVYILIVALVPLVILSGVTYYGAQEMGSLGGSFWSSVAVLLLLTLVGVLIIAGLLAGWVTDSIRQLMVVADDVKDGHFDTVRLEKVEARKDEIGELARVFREMSEEVHAREKRLKEEVRHLTIQIDETRKRMQVAEITETDYFQDLRSKAERLRSRSRGSRG